MLVYLDSVICIYAVEGARSFQVRARTRLATSMICRRRHRSRSTPANGPTIVYGRIATANAAATADAVAARSGEKKKTLASPTWSAASAIHGSSRC